MSDEEKEEPTPRRIISIDEFLEEASHRPPEDFDDTPEPPPPSLWDRIGDVHPGFTYLLVLLILCGFAVELVTATARLGDILAGGSLMGPVIRIGACSLEGFRNGEWWRLLSCVFLHANLLHVGSNLLALALVGGVAERAYGHARFLVLFVGAALAGSFATFLNQGMLAQGALAAATEAGRVSVGSIGASGAIFGVGAAVVVAAFRLRRLLPPWRARALVGATLPLFLSSLVAGFARPGTDNAAHLGGAIAGIALGLVLPFDMRLMTRIPAAETRSLWALLGLAALGALVASGVTAFWFAFASRM